MLGKFRKAAEDVASTVAGTGIDLLKRGPTQKAMEWLRPEIVTGLASGEIFLPHVILRQALEMTVKEEHCRISRFDCLADSFGIEILGDFRGGPGNAIVVQKVVGKLRLENLRVGLKEQRVDVRIVEVSLDSERMMSKLVLWIVQCIFAAVLKDRVATGIAGAFGGDSVEVTHSETDPSLLHIDFSSHPMIRKSDKLTSRIETVDAVRSVLSFLQIKGIEHRVGGVALKLK